MMYKLFKDSLTNTYSIQIIGTQVSFLPDPNNREYQQFVKDIHTNGLEIVEGADFETQISYVDARVAEYPPLQEQLDTIYHHGIPTWHTQIREIKDKYPKTQVGITSIAPLPDWVIKLSR